MKKSFVVCVLIVFFALCNYGLFAQSQSVDLSGTWQLSMVHYTIKKAGKLVEEKSYPVTAISSIPNGYPEVIVSMSVSNNLYFAMLVGKSYTPDVDAYNQKGEGLISSDSLEITTDQSAILRYTFTLNGSTLELKAESPADHGSTITQTYTYIKKN